MKSKEYKSVKAYYVKNGAYVAPGEIRKGEWYRNNYQDESREVEKIAMRIGSSFRLATLRQVGLFGISSDAQPMNVNGAHFYPGGSRLPEYFAQMQRVISEFMLLEPGKADPIVVIDKIAEFYQYASNARPFTQINNSVFMNMANAMLEMHGLAGIPHGILDHIAQRIEPEKFKLVVREKVIETNPTLAPYLAMRGMQQVVASGYKSKGCSECDLLLHQIDTEIHAAIDAARSGDQEKLTSLAVKLDEIGKMLWGWKKSLDPQEKKNPARAGKR